VRDYARASRHFVQWLRLSKLAVGDIDDAVAERFARHRCRCFGTRRTNSVSAGHMGQVRRFLEFLGERKIVRCEPKVAPPRYGGAEVSKTPRFLLLWCAARVLPLRHHVSSRV